jgi:hypothetical protein
MSVVLGPHPKRKEQFESGREQGAEKDIWTQDGRSNRRMETVTQRRT